MKKLKLAKLYSIEEAVALLKELSTVKFKETVDVAVNLGIDPRKSDQNVRGATTLPHGTGKDRSCCCFYLKAPTLKLLKKPVLTLLVWMIWLSKLKVANGLRRGDCRS